jgi:hypothetical protein
MPVYTAWDIGVRDATAIWFFQPLLGGINVIDYYESSGVGVDHYAQVLKERGYTYKWHYVPHDGMVKEWGSGRTRVEVMMSMGLKPHPVPDHRLMDGISAGRVTIPMARFDRLKCRDGIEAMKQYRSEYDEERKVLKPTPLHDWACHGADAWRYLAMAWRALKPPPKPDPPPVFAGIPIGYMDPNAPTMNDLWKDHAKHRERTWR